MEHAADRPDDVDTSGTPGTRSGSDRDLVALEALEQELASLEGELDRVEQVRPTPSPDTGPDTPPDTAP